MTLEQWLLIAVATGVIVYIAFVLALLVAGRRGDARALAGFIPDCIVLGKRLFGDPRVPRRRKILLAALIGYLALPIDVVPDFLPVVGQLDDAIIAALVLRAVLRGVDAGILHESWPGPERSLAVILRLAGIGRASGEPGAPRG